MAKPNVLIIDDNTKNIQLAANVLKSTSLYQIFFATSGEKGIEQLKSREYSLILLDINMPGIDGYQTAQIIKNDPLQKQIPIIFLSANANKESIHKGFESGGADYVTKPFDEAELIHRVHTHVELFNSRQKLQTEVDDTKVLLEQYKEAVDAGSLVSKTNPKGYITYVNDKFCETSQYMRKELLGVNHNIVRHPDVEKSVFKDLWDTIQAKKTWSGIIKNRAKDGTAYYVESTVMPILNANGETIEYISIRTDVSKEIQLREEIVSSQKEILHTLGELGEWRSKETGKHVNRVSLFSEVLALAYGCSEKEVQLLKMASPMHDIGKVVIPDNILLKPEKLTSEEFEIMKNHATYGWEIFHKSKHELLQTAALISYEHHERWDGNGYPRGLRGKDIHLFGRITAVADVFDALSHDRVYKKAWTIEASLDFIREQSGKAFEPKIVDLLLQNIDTIIEIKTLHAD
ncbi:MAG: PAS domain S-box-containing protein [Sulfurimonas sp.]|jgi:PAS domain S-box-containing protein|uniref:HD domain-containing phosphohydrolase n=1 Tax=Sulfurimonas sp. TaxID=2022749 RepID=UPI0039E4BFB0